MPFTPQERAFGVVTFAKEGSPSVVRRRYRRRFGRNVDLPSRKSILRWYDEYLGRGDSKRKKRTNTRSVFFLQFLFPFVMLSFRWVRTELKEAEVVDAFRQSNQLS